nr:hypothetical protein [Paraburkholderia mimosarum]
MSLHQRDDGLETWIDLDGKGIALRIHDQVESERTTVSARSHDVTNALRYTTNLFSGTRRQFIRVHQLVAAVRAPARPEAHHSNQLVRERRHDRLFGHDARGDRHRQAMHVPCYAQPFTRTSIQSRR